ncbi:MAG: adenine deaminase [Methanomassiliicoccales archaeon]|nr:adenine deaminase [Methanomassiliicoccales archaeon]
MEPRSIEGQFVDVIEGKVYPARVSFADGRVLAVERLDQAPEHHILPGFVESHIHIESSQLCPSRFAEASVPHGTTSVINDPHEISNVLGMTGVRYMLDDANGVPLRTYFTAPSCVPSTKHETSGAVFGKEEIDLLLRMKEFVALGEVMDFPAVLRDDTGLKEKIKVAREYWKPVDGHCPGLIGSDLVKYINAGISSDHESLTADEAEEKFHLGMWIMVQEGSANRNLRALLPFAKANECFLVSDDLQATDLMSGHLDLLLRKAVALGMDPMHAIRAVTAWPSWHYFLPGGSLAKGKVADIVIVDDLKNFNVQEVYIAGDLVAKGGKALFTPRPVHLGERMAAQHRRADEFTLPHAGPKAKVRVIRVVPNHINSKAEVADLEVKDGVVQSDLANDVITMAVVNRYHQAPVALGFVSGFKVKRGAVASTVAHDSHNIIAIGPDPECLAQAVNKVTEQGGGYYVTDKDRHESLVLDVAGLMSTAPCHAVAEDEARVFEMLARMGCELSAPMMTLSFQSLLVVPELKLCDKGLFDTKRQEFVPVVIA